MKESNTLITTQDGTSLYVISLAPNNKNLENSKTLLLIHGYHEYGGRYREVAKTFVKAGYRVVIPDMRGHGHSSGARGHVMQWSDYHDDLDAIIKFIDVPKEKLALLGHSNGGLLAATFILDRPKRVGVAALSSPLMGLSMVPPKWKILLGKGISRCLPLVSLPTEVQPEWTCKTPSVVKNFQEDPLNHHSVNTRWFTESLFAIEHAMQWAHTLSIPLLIMQAGDDKIVSNQAVQKFANACGDRAIYREIEGAYHELLFDPEGQKRALEYLAWIDTALEEAS